MENKTEKIFSEQLEKLPREVVTFISSTNWDDDLNEIGSLYNLSKEELWGFKREVNLILLGLVHPDAFTGELAQEVGIKEPVLKAIVGTTEQKIFAPIRPALIQFFENERAAAEARGEFTEEEETVSTPKSPVPMDVAPANLPTETKEAPLLPPLIPKTVASESVIAPHPFEEKMQKAFTGTTLPRNTPMPATFSPEPSFTAPAPEIPQVSPSTPVYTSIPNGSPRGTLTHDPYREPVE